MLRALVLVIAACSSAPDPGRLVALAPAPGPIASLAFEPDGAPVIATGAALFRWDGSSWQPYPADEIAGSRRVSIDADGNTFALAEDGALYALGDERWDRIDGGLAFVTAPTVAADGTRYALALAEPLTGSARIVFAEATEWIDSTIDVPIGCLPLADPRAGVWCETNDANGSADGGAVHVDRTTAERFPLIWGAAPRLGDAIHALAIRSDGTHLGASYGIAPDYGSVVAWRPGADPDELTSGSQCDANGTAFTCPTGGGFIYATAHSPTGAIFELFARADGAPPALLQLHDDSWYAIVAALDAPAQLAVDHQGQLHAYAGATILRLEQ